MPLSRRPASVVPLIAALLLAGCGSAPAAGGERPGKLVTLGDGRKINLQCAGRGSPTVILESGFGANAGAWYKVQPTLARQTRVCSYDRAGYGFSDPGPDPRDGAAAARDLDAALTAAGIEGPYIVVGHSAGGLYARLFAARRPGEVQGLVLLDPTVEQVARSPGADGLGRMRARLERCLAAASASPPPPDSDPAWKGCTGKEPSKHDLQVAHDPRMWRNQLSELNEIFGRTSRDVMRIGGLLNDVPAYVITASETAASAPQIPTQPPVSAWEFQHQQLSAGFRVGYQQTVLSGHLVMIDRPEIAISAVSTMIEAARAGSPPPPLPPSEGQVSDAFPKAETPGEAAGEAAAALKGPLSRLRDLRLP